MVFSYLIHCPFSFLNFSCSLPFFTVSLNEIDYTQTTYPPSYILVAAGILWKKKSAVIPLKHCSCYSEVMLLPGCDYVTGNNKELKGVVPKVVTWKTHPDN